MSKGPNCCARVKKPFYKDKTIIVALSLSLITAVSYLFPILAPFRRSLFMYLGVVWWAVLAGLILGGIVDHFIPREYISKVLAGGKKRTVFHAVVLGFFMSVCSHGILALAIQLHKKGASTSSVISFLLASPWANLPLTLMLAGFFGLAKALYIVACAVVIAVVSGLIYQVLESRNIVERNKNRVAAEKGFSILGDIKERAKRYDYSPGQIMRDIKGVYDGSLALSNMVLWWILIGIGLASLAGAYIPQGIFQRYMGPTILGMAVTLFMATIMEVCSEGTSPLAFEIFRQTGALGNSFVFLMAGVTTDYTEIGLLWHNVGRRAAIWLPIITVPQVIFWGIVANMIF